MSQTSAMELEYAVEPKLSVKERALRAAFWAFLAYGINMVLRLGGSLVLTRLLMPQYFGVMALVGTLWQGVEMLSDIGVSAILVRDRRTEDPAFLNAVWTLAMVRGLALVAVVCAMAPVAAYIYKQPLLMWLLPIVTASSLFNTVAAPRISLATRDLRLGRQGIVDLSSYALSLVVTISWAALYPSVWALVGGLACSVAFRCAAVFVLLPGPRLQWRWDTSTIKDVLRFGRWIVLSSTTCYVSRQTDRFVISTISFAFLGVYSIALTLSDAVAALSIRLTSSILFPALSAVHRDDPARAARAYYKARLRLDLLFMPGLGCLMVVAPFLIRVLYDARYAAAGWMLQLLAIRTALACLGEAGATLFVAVGKPNYGFASHIGRLVGMGVGMSLGWWWGGEAGLIYGIALSEAVPVLVQWVLSARLHLLWPRREALALGLFGCGIAVGLAVQPVLSTVHFRGR